MSLVFKILQLADIEDVTNFEMKIAEKEIPDEMTRMMQSWSARWRKESLDHYIPMGWSFVARNEQNAVMGYFIAQPLLFFDGQTQTLWMEHIQASSKEVRDQLCEIGYKLAREKHLQKIIFPNHQALDIQHIPTQKWQPPSLEAKTTKVSS